MGHFSKALRPVLVETSRGPCRGHEKFSRLFFFLFLLGFPHFFTQFPVLFQKGKYDDARYHEAGNRSGVLGNFLKFTDAFSETKALRFAPLLPTAVPPACASVSNFRRR